MSATRAASASARPSGRAGDLRGRRGAHELADDRPVGRRAIVGDEILDPRPHRGGDAAQ
jgi:hypothetical protein